MSWLLYPLIATVLGFIIDMVFGDPEGLPHPVMLIGKLITAFEKLFRRLLPKTAGGERAAGGLMFLCVAPFATPYAGKEGFQNGKSVPLAGLCLIKRGEVNGIRRVKPGEILSEIMNQVFMPYEAETVVKTLDLLDAIFKNIPSYILECDISENAVKASFEALTGESYGGKNEN